MRKDELDTILEDLLPELEMVSEGPQEDELICECHVVSLFHLRDLARESGNCSLEFFKTSTGLGTGCGSCLKACDSWLTKTVITDT